MQNTNSPPKYGAEGPPGGAEEWNRQRYARTQPKVQKMFQQIGEAIRNGPMGQRMQERQQSMTQPKPWDQVGRVQWGQQGAPQGGPPPMPPPGAGAGPQPGMGIMPMPAQGAPPPDQGSAMQQMAQRARQMPEQQTGMAGLGAGMAKLAQMRKAQALRGGGQIQEQ